MFSFRDQQPAAYQPPSCEDEENRVYLVVPYDNKEEAKKLGAKWDKTVKKWYAPKGERALVERWGEEARMLTALEAEDRMWGGNTLGVEFQPKSCWCKKIQYSIQRIDRERVQDFVLGRTNRTCETCGVQDVERDFHVHGRWVFEDGTQRLVRLMALCERCYESTHFGSAHYNGRRDEAFAHLKTTLKKTDAECQAHIDGAYERLATLNKQKWMVDLSLLRDNGILCETASRMKSFQTSKKTTHTQERKTKPVVMQRYAFR